MNKQNKQQVMSSSKGKGSVSKTNTNKISLTEKVKIDHDQDAFFEFIFKYFFQENIPDNKIENMHNRKNE